jgi:hypothetical protein
MDGWSDMKQDRISKMGGEWFAKNVPPMNTVLEAFMMADIAYVNDNELKAMLGFCGSQCSSNCHIAMLLSGWTMERTSYYHCKFDTAYE